MIRDKIKQVKVGHFVFGLQNKCKGILDLLYVEVLINLHVINGLFMKRTICGCFKNTLHQCFCAAQCCMLPSCGLNAVTHR